MAKIYAFKHLYFRVKAEGLYNFEKVKRAERYDYKILTVSNVSN